MTASGQKAASRLCHIMRALSGKPTSGKRNSMMASLASLASRERNASSAGRGGRVPRYLLGYAVKM